MNAVNILVLDKDENELTEIVGLLDSNIDEASVKGFNNLEDAVNAGYSKITDIAFIFMDSDVFGTKSESLIDLLFTMPQDTDFIFVTSDDKVYENLYRKHSFGYIQRPVMLNNLLKEFYRMYGIRLSRIEAHSAANVNEQLQDANHVRIRTFGNFECFIDGEPVRFKYQKTKEMLAYLVDRKGSLISNGELISVLWEENSDNKLSYLKNLKADLFNVLNQAGCADIIIKQRGAIGIHIDKVDCDYFDFLRRKRSSFAPYLGEYITQYSWSEVTHAYLENFYKQNRSAIDDIYFPVN